MSGEIDNEKERFNFKKLFIGLFSAFNPILWAKDLVSLFSIRKIVIYLLIAGGIFCYAWNTGYQDRPVKIDVGYGKEARVNLDGGQYLYIDKNGKVFLKDIRNNTIKQISVKDVPNLREQLSSFGINFKPIVVGAGSIDKEGKPKGEIGIGFELLRFWKLTVDAFATSYPAVYVGTSYMITSNTGIGVGGGYGLTDGSRRVIIYGKIRF